MLALDDLGATECLVAWQRNLIEHIVCARYDASLPILVTSNIRLADIANLHGERVASRLSEMVGGRMRELVGFDWRTAREHTNDRQGDLFRGLRS